jgi:hypothetical protein
VPAQFVQLIQGARARSPYEVEYVDHKFFKDFSEAREYSSIRPGRKVGDPTVTDLRCLKYTPSGEVLWKLQYSDLWQNQLHSRKTKHGAASLPSRLVDMKPLYSSSLKIKADKFKDLQFLKLVILPDYHSFFDSLSH